MGLEKLTKNISYIFIARILTMVLASGSMIFLVRYFGPEKLGIYAFVITILFIFGTFSDPGISMFLTKEMAQNRKNIQKYFSTHLTVQLLITVVTGSFLIITALFARSPLMTNLLLIGTIGLLLNNVIFPFATVLNAMEDMKYNSICALLAGVATAIITFIGIYYHFTLYYFIFLGIISSLISCIVLILFSRRYVKLQFAWDRTFIKKLFLGSLPFFALTATGLLYTRIDLLMLKLIDSNQAAGLYNAAYKIIFFLFIIPISLRSAIYPMLSHYHKNKQDKLLFVTSKSIKYMLIISTLISIVIFLHADLIIQVLFGDEFILSGSCLKLLIWMFIPYCGYIITMYHLNAGGDVKYVMKISMLGLVINIFLNFCLIPSNSIFGAAIATIVTEIIVFLALVLKTWKEYQAVNENHFIIKLCFISLSGLFVSIFLPEYFKGVFFVLYFLLMVYLLRIIDGEEKYAFRFIYKSFIDKITGRVQA